MSPFRSGFVAVVGRPNVGKSTLVNAMVGTKVSIVTQKVQTTRFPVKGVAMAGQSQIVLVDTPGIFTPRRRLDRAVREERYEEAARIRDEIERRRGQAAGARLRAHRR